MPLVEKSLVKQWYNGVTDTLEALVYMVITKEPVVTEADQARGTSALVVDVSVRGVWQPHTESLLDTCVIDRHPASC